MKNGYDPEFGARPVQRLIRREVLAGLSKYLLQNPEVKVVYLNMGKDNVQFIHHKLEQQAA